MYDFLKGKGPENGDQSQAYELAWEFFKRRDLVGYPLVKDEEMASGIAIRENRKLGIDEDGNDEVIEDVDVAQPMGPTSASPNAETKKQTPARKGARNPGPQRHRVGGAKD